MVKHTQTIQLFDHLVGMTLKGLIRNGRLLEIAERIRFIGKKITKN